MNEKKAWFQNDASGSTQISLHRTFYSRDMAQVTAIQGSGMGSTESAVQNLVGDLVHEVYGSCDIRNIRTEGVTVTKMALAMED